MKKWDMHPKYLNGAKRYRELYHNDKQLLLDRDHQGISENGSVHCESLCGNINGAHWSSFVKILYICECESTTGVNYLANHQGDAGKQHVMNVDSETRRRQLELVSSSIRQVHASIQSTLSHLASVFQLYSKQTAVKHWRDYQSANRNTSNASYSSQKQLGNNDNSILHPN